MDTQTPRGTGNINPWMVVAITLGCVFIIENAASLMRTSDSAGRAKRSETLLTGQEERARKSDEYLKSIEEDEKRTRALLESQEQAGARFQQVLTNWKRQQKEYQAYLDSLKKPQ